MRSRLRALLALTVSLLLVGCCDNDCPSCPEPEPEHIPDYHLLYSYVGNTIDTKYVLTYSSKTGEVIDSAEYGGNPFVNMAYSHDGRYAVYTSNYDLELGASETWVTDTESGDTVSYLYGVGALAAYISPGDDYVLITGGPIIAIATFPDLTIVYQDSVSSWAGGFHPRSNKVFVCFERALDSLFVIDYSGVPVQISSFHVMDKEGRTVSSLGPLLVTSDYLLLNSYIPYVATYLQLYDPDSLKLVYETSARMYRGVNIHPDGNRLFLSYNGGYDRPWDSGVDIYYFSTGNLVPYITPDEIACCYEGIAPTDIQFLPDGDSFFILDGGTGFWFGPILQINTATKEVMRVIRPDDGNSSLIRLNPKDWAY